MVVVGRSELCTLKLVGLVTASAELGSSRRPPRQWNVQLRRAEDGRVVVVAVNLSRDDAERLAERVNDLLAGRAGLSHACAVCGAEIVQPVTGRPRMYCSDACKHAAWRDRCR
jgi:hypothetical protein